MNTHDLRRCDPIICPQEPSGLRAVVAACRCDHAIRQGDYVLVPNHAASGARYRVVFARAEAGEIHLSLAFAPRTVAEVQEQEREDQQRIKGVSA